MYSHLHGIKDRDSPVKGFYLCFSLGAYSGVYLDNVSDTWRPLPVSGAAGSRLELINEQLGARAGSMDEWVATQGANVGLPCAVWSQAH